jgi:hypothetical protein
MALDVKMYEQVSTLNGKEEYEKNIGKRSMAR